MKLTREDIVTLVQAIEEFRDEYAGPHHDANRAFAERLNEVLRTAAGDEFEIAEAGEVRLSSGEVQTLIDSLEAVQEGPHGSAYITDDRRPTPDEVAVLDKLRQAKARAE